MNLFGKRILIGVGGGIAGYRIAELVRLLKKSGMQVRCVMTRSATEFVSPLSFEALSGEKVHTELFDLTSEREMGHIQLARWADAVIIAPATANLIARFAHGIADDLLSTIIQVCDKPVLLAPAMNSSMWSSAATQCNIQTLLQSGMKIVGPESGELACGESGLGRLSELRSIISALLPLLSEQSLNGQRWVLNAGPTVEAWDGVRTLSNRATGMLGALIADLAAIKGADVSIIAGPGTPETHPQVKRHNIETAADMLTSCEREAAGSEVFIATAAVSDYRFNTPVKGKIKRADCDKLEVSMIANPDIVASIAAMRQRPAKVVAFAAEATDHIRQAREKLTRKGVDAIVANDITNMGSSHANGWWISHDSETRIDTESKIDFAEEIITKIMEISDES